MKDVVTADLTLELTAKLTHFKGNYSGLKN